MSQKKKEMINEETGEVLQVKSFNGFFSAKKVEPLDYSDSKQEQFEEIPPFTKDSNGKWLNDTSQPILISKGFIDVDEYINQFKDDVDIYKLLEKVALTGDMSLLNQREGWFGDSTIFPDNIHEAAQAFGDNVKKMESIFTKDEIAQIISGEKSPEEIADSYVERQKINKKDVSTYNVVEEKKEESEGIK